jgi:IS605 OrfB family transposase
MMKTIQTFVDETPEQRANLDDTLFCMAQAQNFVVSSCYGHKETNTFRMHHINYPILREKFSLPAQLAVIANKYACASVKTTLHKRGKQPKFSGTSIHYDKRSCTINLDRGIASLLTKNGRIKLRFSIPEYFKKYLDWNAKECNLVRCRDGKFRLMISVEKPAVLSNKRGKILGIDRGISNLIATSDGWIYDSNHVFSIKKKYVRLRSELQSKGTRSSQRHLSKVRGKEQRFMRDVNHCLSRQLVNSVGKDGVIVLEKLKGIREARHRRKQNWLFSNWAFYQLEQFLSYKGTESGVAIEFVRAKDTSKTCSVCGNCDRRQRKGSTFVCKACGVVLHADLNASVNILHRYTNTIGLPCQPAYCSSNELSKPTFSKVGS